MKTFLNVVKGLRVILKYAGFILVITEIISFAADKIEAYAASKDTAKNVENGGAQ